MVHPYATPKWYKHMLHDIDVFYSCFMCLYCLYSERHLTYFQVAIFCCCSLNKTEQLYNFSVVPFFLLLNNFYTNSSWDTDILRDGDIGRRHWSSLNKKPIKVLGEIVQNNFRVSTRGTALPTLICFSQKNLK